MVGGRGDRVQDTNKFDGTSTKKTTYLTPEISLTYLLSPVSTLRAMYREVHRFPTLRDRYLRAPAISDETLSPEKMKSTEVGYNYTLGHNKIDISIFFMKWDNYYNFAFNSRGVNSDNFEKIRGIEIDYQKKLTDKVLLTGNFSKIKLDKTSHSTAILPDTILYNRLSYKHNNLLFSIAHKGIHGAKRVTFDKRPETKGVNRFDATARLFVDNLEFALSGNNITDKRLDLPSFPTEINERTGFWSTNVSDLVYPGRTITLEMIYRVK